MLLPDHSDVANAIGAVVGQVTMQAKGTVEASGQGQVSAHMSAGPRVFATEDAAFAALEIELGQRVTADAEASGVDAPQITTVIDRQTATVENAEMFISGTLTVSARGRPRISS